MAKITNLTIDGQVTIPKDVRDALGLKPGDAVEISIGTRGEAIVRPVASFTDAEYEARYQAALARIAAAQEHFRDRHDGRSTEEIMRELRGDEAMR